MASVEFFEIARVLQERLLNSEQQRLQLEQSLQNHMRSNNKLDQLRLMQLKSKYRSLQEYKHQSMARNKQILKQMQDFETHLSALSATTERLRMLKAQYEDYIERKYPGWREEVTRQSSEIRAKEMKRAEMKRTVDQDVYSSLSQLSSDIPGYRRPDENGNGLLADSRPQLHHAPNALQLETPNEQRLHKAEAPSERFLYGLESLARPQQTGNCVADGFTPGPADRPANYIANHKQTLPARGVDGAGQQPSPPDFITRQGSREQYDSQLTTDYRKTADPADHRHTAAHALLQSECSSMSSSAEDAADSVIIPPTDGLVRSRVVIKASDIPYDEPPFEQQGAANHDSQTHRSRLVSHEEQFIQHPMKAASEVSEELLTGSPRSSKSSGGFPESSHSHHHSAATHSAATHSTATHIAATHSAATHSASTHSNPSSHVLISPTADLSPRLSETHQNVALPPAHLTANEQAEKASPTLPPKDVLASQGNQRIAFSHQTTTDGLPHLTPSASSSLTTASPTQQAPSLPVEHQMFTSSQPHEAGRTMQPAMTSSTLPYAELTQSTNSYKMSDDDQRIDVTKTLEFKSFLLGTTASSQSADLSESSDDSFELVERAMKEVALSKTSTLPYSQLANSSTHGATDHSLLHGDSSNHNSEEEDDDLDLGTNSMGYTPSALDPQKMAIVPKVNALSGGQTYRSGTGTSTLSGAVNSTNRSGSRTPAFLRTDSDVESESDRKTTPQSTKRIDSDSDDDFAFYQ